MCAGSFSNCAKLHGTHSYYGFHGYHQKRCSGAQRPVGGGASSGFYESEWKRRSGSKGADPRSRYEEQPWSCLAQLTHTHTRTRRAVLLVTTASRLPYHGSSWKPWWLKTENRPGRVRRPRLTATRARLFRPLAKVTWGDLAGRAKLSLGPIPTGSRASDTSSG